MVVLCLKNVGDSGLRGFWALGFGPVSDVKTDS